MSVAFWLTQRSRDLHDGSQGDETFCAHVLRELGVIDDDIQYRFGDVTADKQQAAPSQSHVHVESHLEAY
jgi:hypothetical protein